MIKLTKRLELIAKEIKNGESMADIGTDHGLLPLYLWDRCISPHVIMTDVNEGPVKTAERNARQHNPEFTFDIRKGNGLEIIEPFEVDDIVIAGMGGMLISEILASDIDKTRTFKKLILQPRSKQGHLRWFLLNNGFKIKREKLVLENGHFCNIITAVPSNRYKVPEYLADEPLDSCVWDIPIKINHRDSLYESFLIKLFRTEKKILLSMRSADSADEDFIKKQENRVMFFKKVLDDERIFYDDEYGDEPD